MIHRENIYTCEECSFSTKITNEMKRHTINHRNSKNASFVCDQCSYTSKQKGHLDIHVRSKHKGEVFKCEICNYSATQLSNLRRHKQAKHLESLPTQGRFTFPNRMNFRKVPNGLWPPPLIFGKLYCGFCDKIATKVRMFIMAGLLCIIWSYFPWDACSTTVQHGNWLKTYPKKTLLYHFHAEKALFKGPNFAI